ncbi:acyltransferase family protein [[Erwinia] mediterraneensis]|uniref:acyltransferase family protein n=1 Tax=[Erwinia] mediterraneensis TaxID=2161819 RepID=UPI001031CBAD|nr:acyltransferase family protein [[Erwinia] mediterraneensis]
MLSKNSSIPYRKDIDGLRALAVIAVIIFHAGISLLPSGFIGVDIFFVISGYLMTSITNNQIKKNKFSLTAFFVHRLWRIQPALIVMSTFTLILAAFYFLPQDFITFLHSAKYNAIFLSNQYFSRQTATYASPESDLFLLLHTWSLAIEWQWYFIISLTVYIGYKASSYIKSNHKITVKQTSFISSLFVITIIFGVISLMIAQKKPGEAYYFLTTRLFEFLAGGTTFFLSRLFCRPNMAILSTLSTLSLCLLAAISMQHAVIETYPDLLTVLVVVASAVILFSGSHKERIITSLLSQRILVFIGKISYSLYLWHWPVFSFCRYMDYTLEGKPLYMAFLAVISLSLLSYYLIEKPMRRVRYPLKYSVMLLIFLPAIIFSFTYPFVKKNAGFPQRISEQYNENYLTLKKYEERAKDREQCLGDIQDPNKCQLGDLSAKKSSLLIGDSNSNHFWGFFDVLGKDAHIRITALSTPSCLALPGIYQFDWWTYKNIAYRRCHDNAKHYYELITQNHYDYVILGEVWSQYARGPHLINKLSDERSDILSKKRMQKAMRDALDIIEASGARPVIIKTISTMPPGYQGCLRHMAITQTPVKESTCGIPVLQEAEDKWTYAFFEKLQQEYPTLLYIDPKDVQCTRKHCETMIGTLPVYRDVGHITDYASYNYGYSYLEKFGNPLR